MERHNQRTISKMYETNKKKPYYRQRNIWFNNDENVWSDDEDEDDDENDDSNPKRAFTMSYVVGDCMKRIYGYMGK